MVSLKEQALASARTLVRVPYLEHLLALVQRGCEQAHFPAASKPASAVIGQGGRCLTARSSGICACSRSCELMRQFAQAAINRDPKRSLDWNHSTKGPGRLRGYSNFQRAWTKLPPWDHQVHGSQQALLEGVSAEPDRIGPRGRGQIGGQVCMGLCSH